MKIKKSQLKELVRQSIFDEIQEGGPGSGRPTKPGSAKDTENKMMKASDDANKKMDADEKEKETEKHLKQMAGDDEESAEDLMKQMGESKGKRCTVKEVKKWFKTLEENRYKKTYASDARRVSWLVNNNLSEDYESMPISMRKKWSKAAYGRERYLAKEFVKHLNSKQMNEQKLRELIRKVIIKEIRG